MFLSMAFSISMDTVSARPFSADMCSGVMLEELHANKSAPLSIRKDADFV